MNNLIPVVATWVKSHVIATVVVSTVVVGGAVATPVIVHNMEESKVKVEEKQPIKEVEETPVEEIEETKPVETEPIKQESTKKTTSKPTNKETTTKTSSVKTTQNTTVKTTQIQQDGLSTSNHKIYYNGKEIIKFDIYKTKYWIDEYFPTPLYNESEIKNLPKNVRQDIPKYVCQALKGYQDCGYNDGTQRGEIYNYLKDWLWTKERVESEKSLFQGESPCTKYFKSQQYKDDLMSDNRSEYYMSCKVEYGYTLETYERIDAENKQYAKYIDEDKAQFDIFKAKVKAFYKLLDS